MLVAHKGRMPRVGASTFIEASARIIGDVDIGDQSSIWFNVVVRGDVNSIRIGRKTNIQDGTVIHVTHRLHATVIGDEVTVGHNVTLHGCTIGNRCLIGMGAVIMDGVVIGDDCMVAAGSLVSPGTVIPSGMLVLGAPAKIKRALDAEEIARLKRSAENYLEYMRDYLTP